MVSQPSSCQRTRSAVAASVSGSRVRQTRSTRVPSWSSATTFRRRQFRPVSLSRSCRLAARARAANAAASTRSIGSSGVIATARSSTGSSGATRRSGAAEAMRWMRMPLVPKRVVTAFGGSFASSPRVEMPNCPSALTVSMSAASDSSATNTPSGCAARNSAEPPGGTTWEARAAMSAVAISSAAPAWVSMPRREAASISISSALSSDP